MVACLFLAVLALTQLSILMTRNPSFWWRFGPKTAPPPSLWLVIPVLTFCAASTIIAVYWPRSLQPDGGRGSLEGAGATYTLGDSLCSLRLVLQHKDLNKPSHEIVYTRLC